MEALTVVWSRLWLVQGEIFIVSYVMSSKHILGVGGGSNCAIEEHPIQWGSSAVSRIMLRKLHLNNVAVGPFGSLSPLK